MLGLDGTTDLLACGFAGVQNRQTEIDIFMRLRDNVSRDYFADALACRGARVNCTANGSDVTTHDRGHESRVDLFPTDEANVRGFDHCVGSFDHRHQATTFDHSECFRHQTPPGCSV